MMRSYAALRCRAGRSPLAVVVYLAGFLILVVVVSKYYLIPALQVSKSADPMARKLLSLQAMLVMLVMLFVLLIGLLMTFRVGRFFRPRQSPPRKPTVYVDAWKESGRRLQVPDEPDQQSDVGLQ